MENTTATKVIRRKKHEEVQVPQLEETKADKIAEIIARRKMLSLAERVANDTFYYKNYYFEGARDAFKGQKELQTVSRYFPYSEHGPLFVDEPINDFELENCKIKGQFMKANKMKYLVIKKGMNELDCIEALV